MPLPHEQMLASPQSSDCKEISTCRSCGGANLAVVLDLGNTPLANALLKPEEVRQQKSYPLVLLLCQTCYLVQLKHTVAAEVMFSNYPYFSSFADTMVNHARVLADRISEEHSLNNDSLVVEIGSNDGYLLQFYAKKGIQVVGIEPAQTAADVAIGKGITTVVEYFNELTAEIVHEKFGSADVIHAHNVFAHIDDIHGVLKGFSKLLKDTGVIVIEVPYLIDLIDNCEFDTVYHEHLFYFSLTSLKNAVEQHGLFVQQTEREKIHGGTLRLFIGKNAAKEQSVELMLKDESDWGVQILSPYEIFQRRVDELGQQLRTLLQDLKHQGKSVVAYGASAKGATLLSYFKIDSSLIDYVVDRSTVKQGKLTPGTHLRIFPPDKLLQDQPDYVLLLVWNFAEEILKQQAEFLRNGGKFIIPVPKVKVLPDEVT